eukprot:4989979-Pyramimonas_sp.AAC.1
MQKVSPRRGSRILETALSPLMSTAESAPVTASGALSELFPAVLRRLLRSKARPAMAWPLLASHLARRAAQQASEADDFKGRTGSRST